MLKDLLSALGIYKIYGRWLKSQVKARATRTTLLSLAAFAVMLLPPSLPDLPRKSHTIIQRRVLLRVERLS